LADGGLCDRHRGRGAETGNARTRGPRRDCISATCLTLGGCLRGALTPVCLVPLSGLGKGSGSTLSCDSEGRKQNESRAGSIRKPGARTWGLFRRGAQLRAPRGAPRRSSTPARLSLTLEKVIGLQGPGAYSLSTPNLFFSLLTCFKAAVSPDPTHLDLHV